MSMKKNYFKLPISFFNQILMRNCRLEMSDDSTSAGNWDDLEVENLTVSALDYSRNKIDFFFTAMNLAAGDSLVIEVQYNGNVLSTLNLTGELNSIRLKTNINNQGQQFTFVFRYYVGGTLSQQIIKNDTISYNVEVLRLNGIAGLSDRSCKFCWIEMKDDKTVPYINMYPPVK